MKVTFLDLLVLLFIGLKLGGVIDWSWWWVLSPWIFTFSVLTIGLILRFFLNRNKGNKNS